MSQQQDRPRSLRAPLWSLVLLTVMAVVCLVLFFVTDNYQKQYNVLANTTPVPTTAPPMLYAKPTEALLRVGSVGPQVKTLQQRLKTLGYYRGDVDGQYGTGTKNAVMAFQRDNGINADGLAGPETLTKVMGEEAKPHQPKTPAPLPPGAKESKPLLVNRSQALPQDYQPRELVNLQRYLPTGLVLFKHDGLKAERQVADALKIMVEAAKRDGVATWQISEGFRERARQAELMDQQVQKLIADGNSEAKPRNSPCAPWPCPAPANTRQAWRLIWLFPAPISGTHPRAAGSTTTATSSASSFDIPRTARM